MIVTLLEIHGQSAQDRVAFAHELIDLGIDLLPALDWHTTAGHETYTTLAPVERLVKLCGLFGLPVIGEPAPPVARVTVDGRKPICACSACQGKGNVVYFRSRAQ